MPTEKQPPGVDVTTPLDPASYGERPLLERARARLVGAPHPVELPPAAA